MKKVYDAPRRSRFSDPRESTGKLRGTNAILPFPEPKQPPLFTIRPAKPEGPGHLSFTDAFGWLGLPMLFIVLVCIAWTTWLILLTLAPTWTANHLMDTTEFDDGNFWLIVEPTTWMTALSGSGLLLVALGYLYVLLTIVLWRNQTSSLSKRFARRLIWWQTVNRQLAKVSGRWSRRNLASFWSDLTGFHGTKRKFWNLWLKVIDLVLQTIALAQMLEAGFPSTLVYSYAGLLTVNAMSCASTILLGASHSAFTEVLIDSFFDLLFAVVSPIVVLAYCYSNFDFDRHELQINNAVFPAGSFERQSRLLTNPSEVFLFRTSFDSLRILSPTDFLLRIGMNLSFCNRFKRVVEVQIGRGRLAMTHRQERLRLKLIPGERLVPRLAALPLVAFAMLIVAFTHRAVDSSASTCAAYPQCVIYAQRWTSRKEKFCPCLALIDTDKEPKTYDEWINPVDATELVRQLAKSGDLRVLQLINRKLVELPDELRLCRHLKHITLMYTQTTTLPPWTKTFTELEYLHIEGKSGFANLLSVPYDLFEDMHVLTLLHLGVHPELVKLPSFRGLSGLKRVVLAYMYAVTIMPPFTELKKVERMELVYFPALPRLPDLAPLTNLFKFTVFRPMQICCNGFLGTACNLTHPFCTPNPGAHIPQVTCLQQDDTNWASAATLAVLKVNTASVCQGVSAVIPETPIKSNIDMCDSTPFRQCQLPRAQTNDSAAVTYNTGICWNTRMQVLACTLDPYKMFVRKQQIKQRVGVACDPAVEAWLGCPT